jgi:hypothetical protein
MVYYKQSYNEKQPIKKLLFMSQFVGRKKYDFFDLISRNFVEIFTGVLQFKFGIVESMHLPRW